MEDRRLKGKFPSQPEMNGVLQKFIVVLGDPGCGKSLLFPTDQVEFVANETTPCRLILDQSPRWDVLGTAQASYCDQADLVLLCFAIDAAESLSAVVHKWFPEFRQRYPKTPIILVGTKADLRHGNPQETNAPTLVLPEDAERAARIINALAYIEVSGKTRENVESLLTMAALAPPVDRPAALVKSKKTKRRKKHNCSVM